MVVIYHATNDLSGEMNELAAAQGLTDADGNRQNWLARHSLLWELVEKNLRVMVAQREAESDKDRVVLDKARVGDRFGQDLRELVTMAGRDNRLVAVATFSTQLRAEQNDRGKEAGRRFGAGLHAEHGASTTCCSATGDTTTSFAPWRASRARC